MHERKSEMSTNSSACLLGKALTCNYYRGENYFEIDVDTASSKIVSAILHLASGYVTSVTVDMGFVVEAQAEDELPEKLIGAIRACQTETSSAHMVDTPHPPQQPWPHVHGHGFAWVNPHTSRDDEDEDDDG